MKIKVILRDKRRNYIELPVKLAEVVYNNVRDWHIAVGDEATQIGLQTDYNSRDENNEYLVIELEDGNAATFRNSYVDVYLV
jgi:hypothetical protein